MTEKLKPVKKQSFLTVTPRVTKIKFLIMRLGDKNAVFVTDILTSLKKMLKDDVKRSYVKNTYVMDNKHKIFITQKNFFRLLIKEALTPLTSLRDVRGVIK